ncbi:uncharacterized protein LOC103578184 [Microplitis demolitor]|uniref:uncharacterized protein LOC103578184 n=1 Tax=Microplitis demolitor TaxID=69319 RepID=UPI00235B6A28|nr:uncharacterized protein LOC103578184 [Microplitis demolitor]
MFFITVVGFDHVICYLEVEDFDLFLWITFNYPRMVTLNFMMIYVYSLKIIRRQFYFINKSISCLPEVYVDKNNISVEINNIILNPREIDQRLKDLNQLDLDLRDSIKMINKLLSLPLTLAFLMQILQLIVNIYLVLVFFSKKNYSNWRETSSTLTNTGWLLMRLFQLLCTVDICDSICHEGNSKVKIMHELWASKRPDGSKEMLKSISLHQLREPIEIKLYDSLNMNHELLYKLSGVVTTYLIIMIQLDEQSKSIKHHHSNV